ncbi:hypothetical protein FocTR4_00005593 [Fusarium oxysporum f. sp. cubense]|uniref:Uncharacterized protein n=1 Tax=Fusarium oxysporum f. sp. cubense TaxID=61366 RepID=A0A5C6TG67_FUSOC|nr:hypothetical protein FocTR4_00005593 [Fusarium oxysporum f. sp. cubense]
MMGEGRNIDRFSTVIDRAATLPPQIKNGKEHHLIDETHWRDRNFCYLPEE